MLFTERHGQWTKSRIGPEAAFPVALAVDRHGTVYVVLEYAASDRGYPAGLTLVTVALSAVAAQRLSHSFEYAEIAVHDGKLSIAFVHFSDNAERGVWFTRQT
jgi:hypothetical protein